jgi:uncharacterized protein (TIGR00255 family)
MTGFGRAVGSSPRYAVEIEVRSLNNRYLKVRTHVPALISVMEGEIENTIRGRLARGAVDIWIKISDVAPAQAYRLDLELVRRYREFAASLAAEFEEAQSLSISDLLMLPGIVTAGGDDLASSDELRSVVTPLVEKALDELESMRLREGAALAEDLRGRADVLEKLTSRIAERAPQVVKDYRDRLLARVRELLAGSPVDLAEENLLREVSVFAERSDISEEMARIESHLDQLRETLAAENEIGRKLEFVAQELQREVNTIGSKANDAEISRLVVDAKGEIDRIREQSQNLE